MIALIDNYDSFSYNLYQLLGTLADGAQEVAVFRNDALDVAHLAALQPSCLVLSPGPGRPEEAGLCVEAVRRLGPTTPILGVCLGHQAITLAYGGQVAHARHLRHGVADPVHLVDAADPLFAGLPRVIQAARYHSLAAVESALPADLLVTARADDEEVMAVRHRTHQVFGIQFHPESILTPHGPAIVARFLALAGVAAPARATT